jgi:hypothetical protein
MLGNEPTESRLVQIPPTSCLGILLAAHPAGYDVDEPPWQLGGHSHTMVAGCGKNLAPLKVAGAYCHIVHYIQQMEAEGIAADVLHTSVGLLAAVSHIVVELHVVSTHEKIVFKK